MYRIFCIFLGSRTKFSWEKALVPSSPSFQSILALDCSSNSRGFPFFFSSSVSDPPTRSETSFDDKLCFVGEKKEGKKSSRLFYVSPPHGVPCWAT